MIAETGVFLTWALREGRGVPSIPRRRMEDGGFDTLLRMPGARAALGRWWDSALDQVRA